MTRQLRHTVCLLSTACLMVGAALWLCGCGGGDAVSPSTVPADIETAATTAAPPPPAGGTGGTPTSQTYDLTQTLSNQAQLNTIAFSGLAFLTGNLGADSFFPPGKVADWWGF